MSRKIDSRPLKRTIMVSSCFLILPSYVLHYYLQVDVKELFVILGGACLIIALQEARWRLDQELLTSLLLIYSVGVLGSAISGQISQLMMAASLSLCLTVAWCGWRFFVDPRSLKYLLVAGMLLTAGGVVAFLYAEAGGQPIATIELVGGDSYLYLTTFTNAVRGNSIRSAGIFDEPGALAMFITVIVAMNEALCRNQKWSAALLFAGLVTGSLALLIVAIVYLLFKVRQRKLGLVLSFLVAIIGLGIVDERILSFANEFLLSRVELVDGKMAGDNRTQQLVTFFEMVDWQMTLMGVNSAGSAFADVDVSSNPFSIYYNYGVIVWIPYVVLQLWLLYCCLFYKIHLRFSAFAIFATLLQRPYIYGLFWSMMVCVVVVTIYKAQRSYEV